MVVSVLGLLAVLLPVTVARAAPSSEWRGAPTGLGGTAQIDQGEWIHTDFVYDDGGRADNTADLVEVRVRTRRRALDVRVTLNSLRPDDSPRLGLAVAGADDASSPWPDGAPFASPWDLYVGLTPAGGTLYRPDGTASDIGVAVDHEVNTIEFSVPGGAADQPLVLTAAAGEGDADGWIGEAPIVDLAFNHQTIESTGKDWRDVRQGEAIAAGDAGAMVAVVDPAALKRRASVPYVPAPGRHNLIFESVQDLGEGFGGSFPRYRGRFQPAGLYLPTAFSTERPNPLTLVLHSLNNHHNEYMELTVFDEYAERHGAIGLTPLALGVNGWYWDEALVDTLQAWAEVRRRFPVDDDRVRIGGYSMGGYATWRLTTLLPDRFAAGAVWAAVPAYQIWAWPAEPLPSGPRQQPGKTYDQLENLEHIPMFASHGTNDELVPISGVEHQMDRLAELGHPYRFNHHPGMDHFTFNYFDDFTREGAWLRDRQRVVDPAHVVFTLRPAAWATPTLPDERRAELIGQIEDLGYDLRSSHWVRDVVERGSGDVIATVNLTSGGRSDRVVHASDVLGAAPGPPSPHSYRGIDRWLGGAPLENRLWGSLESVDSATVDLDRAGLSADGLVVDVASDGPAVLRLVSGGVVVQEIPLG